MRHHDESVNEPTMSKVAGEHRRVNAPPPAFPMLRERMGCSAEPREARPPFRPSRFEIGQRQGYHADPGRAGRAMVAERPAGRDVRGGDILAICRRYGTERGTVPQRPASVSMLSLLVGDGATGPATSRSGRRVVAGDGTNGLLTVGPRSGVGGNRSSVSLEMRGATTAGPLCAAEPESGTGRGLVDMGARAITLDSVDRRGAGATEAPDLRSLIV